jgi:hypothetical protein
MYLSRLSAMLLLLGTAAMSHAQALLDDRQITLTSATDVAMRRAALINHIWGSAGFPSEPATLTAANIPSPLAGLTNVSRVDELRADMDHSEFSIAYHFIAANPNNRLVVLQNGHGCTFEEAPAPETPGTETSSGLRRAIIELLADGFSVLAVFMPRSTPSDCRYTTHEEMFQISVDSGNPVKFFLEPTAVFLNYLKTRATSDGFPAYMEYSMAGLSGGGWTTTLYAAIDPTIANSFPVAGSLPLYLRWNGSIGDREQTDSALYQLAGYPDLYVMGAAGAGRRQVQILNRWDTCCFGQPQHEAVAAGASYDAALREYEYRVRQALKQVGPGGFRLEINDADTANGHLISWNALVNVILAELEGEKPTITATRSGQSAFGRGMNGRIWHHENGIWTNTNLAAVSAPSALEGAMNDIDLFYRDPGNGLRHAYRLNGVWYEEILSGRIITDPVAVSTIPGRYDVLALGTGYQLFHWSSTNGSSHTRVSPAIFIGPPAVVVGNTPDLHLFARDANRALHHVQFAAGGGTDSGTVQLIGGIMRGFPSALGGTSLRAYVRGQSDTLFEAAQTGSGWQWLSVSTATGTVPIALTGSPMVAPVSSGISVFLRKRAGGVVRFRREMVWTYEEIGGQSVDTPYPTAHGVFGEGPDSSAQRYLAPNWQSLGGRFD